MITNKFLKSVLIILFAVLIAGKIYAQDNLSKGIDAVNRGDYVQALSLLKSAPDSYDKDAYYGLALLKTGSLADAEKTLKAATQRETERPEAYSFLGQVYTAQKKYSDAASQFETAKKYLPLNKTKADLNKDEINLVINVLSAEAQNFIADTRSGNNVDKAIASLTQAKTYDDKNPAIYIGLGDAYYARGAYDIGATNYQASLKYKNNYAPALYGQGMIAFRKKKYADALDYFTKSADADNNFAPAYFEKGLLLYLNDNFQQSVDAFNKYALLVPGSPRGEVYRAKALYGMQNYDESMSILQTVLTADPTNSEANKYMAYDYIKKKDYDKAETFFNNVRQEDLNSEDFMMWSTIYTDKKDYAKASDLLNKSITMDSTDENAYFEYGKALFTAQNYADALPKFSKAIDLGIQNVAAYVYKGITYYYLQDYSNAVTWLDKSIALNSTVNSAYLWRANSLMAAGKFADALDAYKLYSSKAPDDTYAKEQIDKLEKQLQQK